MFGAQTGKVERAGMEIAFKGDAAIGVVVPVLMYSTDKCTHLNCWTC